MTSTADRADSAPVIRVRGLAKTYGTLEAVHDLDLDVHAGEVFALLGPNGAGKTTTVEILEGYRERTAGEVTVLGVDPAKGDLDWRARIGLVLQTPNAFDELTVFEVVDHFAAYYPDHREADAVIADVGLTEKRDVRAGKLSGGQRRRLDVALAIVGRPELVFLDEPTTGFDPEARRRFWHLIDGLAEDGTTVLLTTHYLDEAEALADRVGVIVAGELMAVGTPETLGGRRSAAAQVRYTGAHGVETIHTDNPTRTVTELAAGFGGDIPDLSVTRPSLEDVYLAMIATSNEAEDATDASPAHETTGAAR